MNCGWLVPCSGRYDSEEYVLSHIFHLNVCDLPDKLQRNDVNTDLKAKIIKAHRLRGQIFSGSVNYFV